MSQNRDSLLSTLRNCVWMMCNTMFSVIFLHGSKAFVNFAHQIGSIHDSNFCISQTDCWMVISRCTICLTSSSLEESRLVASFGVLLLPRALRFMRSKFIVIWDYHISFAHVLDKNQWAREHLSSLFVFVRQVTFVAFDKMCQLSSSPLAPIG